MTAKTMLKSRSITTTKKKVMPSFWRALLSGIRAERGDDITFQKTEATTATSKKIGAPQTAARDRVFVVVMHM